MATPVIWQAGVSDPPARDDLDRCHSCGGCESDCAFPKTDNCGCVCHANYRFIRSMPVPEDESPW